MIEGNFEHNSLPSFLYLWKVQEYEQLQKVEMESFDVTTSMKLFLR